MYGPANSRILMKKTRICRLLNITYPILQGGMLWIATAELASAVSNAGGLGVVSPLAAMASDGDPVGNLKDQIAKTRRLTDKPFGVNIPLDLAYAGSLIALLMDQNIETAITAAGDPGHFTEALKASGMRVLHVISNVAQARRAESFGVDAVIAEGIEAAAHNGADELPLFCLIPQVVDAVSVPVVAAGGIVDGRGAAAAFCLGAEGIQLGTRFVAVKENVAHQNYKAGICAAKDTDTVVTCRKLVPTRSLKTPFTKGLLALERAGHSRADLLKYLGYRANRTAQVGGDLTKGEAYCGASAGLIKEVLTVRQVMEQLVDGYHEIAKTLGLDST